MTPDGKIHNIAELLSDDQEEQYQYNGRLRYEALLAISFMNVVNARRDDEPEHRHTTKTLKRKGVVPIAMNRIRLPAAKSSSRADVKAATGGVMPLHLVRGHFKTYTADAPLFGKATGTYWWGWQSRGKAERGVRGHTYEVGPGD